MGIVDEDIAAVRSASDIVGIISAYTPLRKVGMRWTGLCPFHAEKSPSFSVNQQEGLWYCLAGETRVLTWDGPREIRDLAGGTHRILTECGEWVDAPFRSFGVQRLMRVVLTRDQQQKEVYATPEHRWLVRGSGGRFECTTAELRNGHPLAWSFPKSCVRAMGEPSPAGIAHGSTYGEGSMCTRRPPIDEAPTYLAGWHAGYLAADGHDAADGTVSISSADRADLDVVRLVCTRLGIGTHGITTQMRAGSPGEPSPLHCVHLIADDLDERLLLIDEHRTRFNAASKPRVGRGWVVQSVEHTEREEEVFCAVVDGTHSFALEDNILTGNCFGCQAKGDVITFVREIEHLDFVASVEWLAAKSGTALHYTDRDEGAGRKRRAKLVDAVAKAVEWYHQRLLTAPDAAQARSYLRSRGLDGDEVRAYKVGWAPDAWDELAKALKLADDVLKDSGLGLVNRRNRQQDTFRARLLFPIFDAQGDPVAFGGRVMPGGDGPKYKNTPETALYSKSKVLYGLNWAKAGIVQADQAVICEGYTDVIGFARAGVSTAVATCGTALTEDHIRMLRRYAGKLVLAFDADSAGQAAAERFYAWEKTHDVEVSVADLPAGVDPADLARTDPGGLAAAVTGAKPFLKFRLDRALAAANLSTTEGRVKAAEGALDVIREHPNELVRDQYLMELAERTRLEPAQLRANLSGGRRSAVPSAPVQNRRVERDSPELEVLRLAVSRWDDVAGWLDDALFVDEVHAAAFRALAAHESLHEAIESADPETAELLSRLGQEESEADPFDAVVRLVTEAARRRVMELQRSVDPDDLATITWLTGCMDKLRDPDSAVPAAEQLVPWLVERGEEGP